MLGLFRKTRLFFELSTCSFSSFRQNLIRATCHPEDEQFLGWNLNRKTCSYYKQECIPVGCVPSAAVAVSRGGGGYLVQEGCTWSGGEVYLVPGGCTCWGDVPGPGGCTCQGVYLLGGVPAGGCTWSQGGVPAWVGTWSRGVYLVKGGVPAWGVYLVWRGVPGQVLSPPVDRHKPVKT